MIKGGVHRVRMARVVPAVSVLLLLSIVGARAQSAADGSVSGGVYRNRFYKRTFNLPAGLHPRDISSLALPAQSNANEQLLMAAQQGNRPVGMVMISEKLGTEKGQFRDEADFLRRVWATCCRGQAMPLPKAVTSAGGLQLSVLEYKEPGDFEAAVVHRVAAVLLVWKCNAPSQAELNSMTAALATLRPLP